MKKSLILVASVIAVVLLSLPGTANAQVAFGGTFHGPHGSFSIGVGVPFAPAVGAYVPYPYARRVYYAPNSGYGFVYNSNWVPVSPYGSGWVVAASPYVYGGPIVRTYGYGYPYGYYGHGHGHVYASHRHGHVYARHYGHH